VALQDVSISIGAGEIVPLAGPNGTGKTALVRLVAALARPDEGKILVCGRDTSAPRDVRPLIAIVPRVLSPTRTQHRGNTQTSTLRSEGSTRRPRPAAPRTRSVDLISGIVGRFVARSCPAVTRGEC